MMCAPKASTTCDGVKFAGAIHALDLSDPLVVVDDDAWDTIGGGWGTVACGGVAGEGVPPLSAAVTI